MGSQLLATKSIDELHAQEASGNELRRALTATQLTLLGIGGIIGTGIFVLTGMAAAQNAGPGPAPVIHLRRYRLHCSPACATRNSPP